MMTGEDVIARLLSLQSAPHPTAKLYEETLSSLGLLRQDFYRFLCSWPPCVQTELARLKNADVLLCCAIFSMLLQEEESFPGAFSDRLCEGSVAPVLRRLITLLRREYNLPPPPPPSIRLFPRR